MIILNSSLTRSQYDTDISDIIKLTSRYKLLADKRWWAVDGGYGLNHIYLEAAGIDYKKYVPKFNCFHGFFPGMSDRWFTLSEARFRCLPMMFVHNKAHQDRLEKILGHRKRFFLIAHPFHYILLNYSGQTITRRSGSILFLPHTIGKNNMPAYSIEKIITYIKVLPPEFLPITVCLHPNDVTESIIEVFNQNSIKTVSLGGRHDPQFLHRFFWMTFEKEFALIFDISTHVELSVLSGLKIHRMPFNIVYYLPINDGTNNRVCPEKIYWPLYEAFYMDIIDQKMLREAVLETTGAGYVMSFQELSKVIENSEKWYQKNEKPGSSCSFSYRTWYYIEPYLHKLKLIIISIGLRLSKMRGQRTLYFGDFPYQMIRLNKDVL